jgi:hypothetical protein
MQHVDEGTLHAYLDGALAALAAEGALPPGVTRSGIEAHFRACADCSALLEAERRVRDGARNVLLDASVTVDAPPFEMVARRGAAAAGSAALPVRRTLPLAWAASVLIAVGAGWWGSAALRQTPPDPSPAPSQAAFKPDAPAPVPGSAIVEAAEDAAATQPSRGIAGDVAAAAPPPDVEEPVVAASDPSSAELRGPMARAGVESTAAAVVTPTTRLAQQPVTRRIAPVTGSGAAGLTRTAAREDGAVTLSAERNVVAMESLETRPDVQAAPPLPAPPSAAAQQPSIMSSASPSAPPSASQGAQLFSMDVQARSFPAPSARRSREVVSPLQTFRAAVAHARAGELEWRGWSRDAAVRAGLPLVLLGNGGEPQVAVAGLTGEQPMLRVRQRTGDVVVELLVWQEPNARVMRTDGSLATVVMSSGVLPNGDSELLLRLPALESYVVLSGALDARSLLQLADGLVLNR